MKSSSTSVTSTSILIICSLISSVNSTPLSIPLLSNQSQSLTSTSISTSTSTSTSTSNSLSHSILDRIGKYLSSALIPLSDSNSTSNRIGLGLGWGDSSDLPDYMGEDWAWGTTTIEVVKTSAIYLTRPAAFGPRIEAEGGLKGTLLPISTFYRPPATTSSSDSTDSTDSNRGAVSEERDNYGCPVKGGPGWKDTQDSQDDDDDYYDGIGDWETDLLSSSAFYSESSSKPFKVEKKQESIPISNSNYTVGKPPTDFISLIQRGGNCSFVSKVRLAQSIGAIAVIIGEEKSNEGSGGEEEVEKRPVTMYGRDSKDIAIPSSFVTRGSYLDLWRLIEESNAGDLSGLDRETNKNGDKNKNDEKEEVGLEIILSRTDLDWEWPLIDLALLILLLPSIMTIVSIIIHRIRVIRQRRKDRAPKLSVLNLPCLIWRSDGKPWEKVDPNDQDDDEEGEGEGDEAQAQDTNSKVRGAKSRKTKRGDLESDPSAHSLNETESNQEIGSSNPSINLKKHLEAITSSPSTSSSCDQPSSSSSASKINKNSNSTSSMTKASFGNECAICLEDFKDGDKIRLLPCGHIYHKKEIDDWLCRVKKLCPICKRDILVPIPPAPPIELQPENQDQQGNQNEESNESTPLISS